MNMPLAIENRRKAEYIARSWRNHYLLPPDELQAAIHKCDSTYELTELLNVTPDVLMEAFAYYATQGVSFVFPERD
jgi:hypothetical protein